MTSSSRTPLMIALVLAVFAVFPGVARANTICYPDGCAVLNFEETRSTWDTLFGQTTLAQTFEVAIQMAESGGDTINALTRNAAGNITFVDCGNSHTHLLVYNCSYRLSCSGNNVVDYCGNVTACKYGCYNGACNSPSCSLGYVQQGNQCVFSACPSGYAQQNDANGHAQCVFASCPSGQTLVNGQCFGGQCTASYSCQGSDLFYEDASCQTSLVQRCPYVCAGGACVVPAPLIVTWNVHPILVKSGTPVSVEWATQNVSSCTVTGTNGDSWNTTSGMASSTPIIGQTIYKITCQGLSGSIPASVTKSTTVDIIPNFQEL